MKTETHRDSKFWWDAYRIVWKLYGRKLALNFEIVNREANKLYQDEINYKSKHGGKSL